MSRGLFLTLEGGEGSGKSTLIPFIEKYLVSHGQKVVCTREPGGTDIAEEIRKILITKNDQESLCSKSELLLMYAARAQLVTNKIKPLLEQGFCVISDRFDLSTIAYQGYGRGIDLDEIVALRKIAIGDFKPDLTLLLDVDVQKGMQRVVSRGKKDRFESEAIVFFEKVRFGYLDYAKNHKDEVVIIDSSVNLEMLEEKVVDALDKRILPLLKS